MGKKTFRTIIGIAVIALLGGSSCIKGEESNTTLMGLALHSTGNSWWKAATSYATTHAAGLQQPYFLANADSAKQQKAQLVDMAYASLQREACKAIILADQGQTIDSIQKYIDMGIGVILFDCDMQVDYTCRISGDNADAGKKAGDYIKAHLTDPQMATLIIKVEGSPVGTVRADACKAQLSGTLLETTAKGYTQTAGKKAMQEALALPNGDKIGAVYALDDDVATGVLNALIEAGNTTAKVIVGCGGSQGFLSLINSTTDRDLATTVYSPEMITQCVDIAYALIQSGTKPTQKEIITPMPLADRANAAEYLNTESRY